MLKETDYFILSKLPAHSRFCAGLYLRTPFGVLMAMTVWILMGAVIIIAITRYIFSQHHPKWFINDQPSISKTAAFAPSDTFFTAGMNSIAICVFIAWAIGHGYNALKIEKVCKEANFDRTFAIIFNNVSLLLGLIQGITLSLAATVNLEISDYYHIVFSIAAFGSGALVFVSDSFGTSRWRKYSQSAIELGFYFKIRRVISVAVTTGSLWYLYLWLNKNSGFIVDEYVTQVVYVTTEHILVTFSFLYAPLYLFEIFDDENRKTLKE